LKSKFRQNFVLILSTFWCFDVPKYRFQCRNRIFDFCFDFDLLLSNTPTKHYPNFVEISMFRFRDRIFDSDIGILISVPHFDINVEIEIQIPINFDNFNEKCHIKSKLISIGIPIKIQTKLISVEPLVTHYWGKYWIL
jgi:hypothetical protein